MRGVADSAHESIGLIDPVDILEELIEAEALEEAVDQYRDRGPGDAPPHRPKTLWTQEGRQRKIRHY